MSTFRLIEADCIAAMSSMDEASVDAIVTDPPYGIRFMGKAWDAFDIQASTEARVEAGNHDHRPGQRSVANTPRSRGAREAGSYDLSPKANRAFQEWTTRWATEALRVLKPGGHMLVSGGTRTYHRMAAGLEDAGFEIRDCLAWLYGSGFPKSLNLGNGFGTALKPAFEPIVLARKPLIGSVARNVQEFGTGALNIDGTRIDTQGEKLSGSDHPPLAMQGRNHRPFHDNYEPGGTFNESPLGRWPANVILGHSPDCKQTLSYPGEFSDYAEYSNRKFSAEVWDCVPDCPVAMLDEQSGGRRAALPSATGGRFAATGAFPIENQAPTGYEDFGGASRFFYIPKADREERNRGLEGFAERIAHDRVGMDNGGSLPQQTPNQHRPQGNHHPTVKPVELMQWLCRLITPPGGTVLDPFTGSGSTGMAALREGFDFIGIEREPEYVEIARARIIGDGPLLNVEAGT